ncbi:hypothetical protein ABXV18_03285 [Vibrio owensii]|uniref:hypothetical protein n=1 Tax=Vibrio owensii TaxID=696485 RepID=UPI0033934F01
MSKKHLPFPVDEPKNEDKQRVPPQKKCALYHYKNVNCNQFLQNEVNNPTESHKKTPHKGSVLIISMPYRIRDYRENRF